MGIRYILLPCAGIIFPVRVGRGRSYLVSSLDADQVLMMSLGFYTQQRGLLKDHFELVIREMIIEHLSDTMKAYNL